MNGKLILTILIGLVIGSGSLHAARAQSYKPLTAVKAKQRFDKIVDKGFQVTYTIGDKTTTAFVKGKKLSYLRSGKVKLDKQSAVVIAVTNDRALEITTYFTLDEQKQKLTIDRRIRNISADTVTVQTMGQYIDPKLFGVQGHHAKSDLEQTALKRIRAGQLVPGAPILRKLSGYLRPGWDELCICNPPDPVCPIINCPPDSNYIGARLAAITRDEMLLQWQKPTILAAGNARADDASLVGEARYIIDVDFGRELGRL